MVREQRAAGEVLVVGGGAAGMLIAADLAGRGISVSLLEASGFGAEQSNHSHGYLHAGYIYPSPPPALLDHFRASVELWDALLRAADAKPQTHRSFIAFTNPFTAGFAAASWNSAGLSVADCGTPPRFREDRVVRTFETSEHSYDFTAAYGHIANTHLSRVNTIRGNARTVISRDGAVVGVDAFVRRLGRSVLLTADQYVFAAGCGNLELLRHATNYNGRSVNRTSYMLVLRSSALPDISVIMPENESHGLFLASRSAGAEAVWIVSNFSSFGSAAASTRNAALWVRAVGQTLLRTTDVLDTPDLAWAVYPAPKGELRVDPRRMNTFGVDHYGLQNAVVVSPTKLTLAPLLAREAGRVVVERLDVLRRRGTGHAIIDLDRDELAVIPERWTGVTYRQRGELFDVITNPRAEVALGDVEAERVR